MVSKAREDFPEPLGPVMTTSRSRGRVRLMFLRLCWRAPRTTSRSMDRSALARSWWRWWQNVPAGRPVTPHDQTQWNGSGTERAEEAAVRVKTKSIVKSIGAGILLGAIALVARYAP